MIMYLALLQGLICNTMRENTTIAHTNITQLLLSHTNF